uniref:Secreted peptide n=1 Tax=Schizaphis graminum TaxID=13262 RepID=A0A2S2NHM8_SCHGA
MSCFLTAVLAILLVAHGRPRGVCCLAVSVVVNAILLLLLLLLFNHGPLSVHHHPPPMTFVLDVRVRMRCDTRSIRNGNVHNACVLGFMFFISSREVCVCVYCM